MKKILYVEDNVYTANAVKIILGKTGYDVDLAFTGTQGLNMVQGKAYDMILLDIMLPDMSGWDIYAKLKAKVHSHYAFLSAIPISSERMDQLKREGVSDYIVKPFTRDDLVLRINTVFEQ